jgi:uncharacterized protein involved in propanediol utilization
VRGSCPCHHGELLQGAFRDADGMLRAGLVTLPHPGRTVHAHFEPGPVVTVGPGHRPKAERAAALTLASLHERSRGEARSPHGAARGPGRVTLSGGVPPGLGMGSSTADVVATIRAVALAHGVVLEPGEIARIAVAAEAASDPLMFDDGRVRLFAQRDGRVLETLADALPPMRVVGTLLGGPVDTPAEPPPLRRPALYAILLHRLRAALTSGDAVGVARVATASARLNRTDLAPLLAAAEQARALGVQVAHSGNVAGLLLHPAAAPEPAADALGLAGLPVTGSFVVGELIPA